MPGDASSKSGKTTVDATRHHRRRQRSVVVVMVTLVVMATCDATGASSNFYYDNWQCNNYLSADSVVIQSPAGQLLEIHIRDDIPVSISTAACLTHFCPQF